MNTFKSTLAIVVPVLLAIIIFQNTYPVRFRFLFWSLTLPQIVLVIVTALLGVTGGYLLASFQQMRDRKKPNVRTQRGSKP